jgi:hypothetical protein
MSVSLSSSCQAPTQLAAALLAAEAGAALAALVLQGFDKVGGRAGSSLLPWGAAAAMLCKGRSW